MTHVVWLVVTIVVAWVVKRCSYESGRWDGMCEQCDRQDEAAAGKRSNEWLKSHDGFRI